MLIIEFTTIPRQKSQQMESTGLLSLTQQLSERMLNLLMEVGGVMMLGQNLEIHMSLRNSCRYFSTEYLKKVLKMELK